MPIHIRLATEADAESCHAIYATAVEQTPASFEFEPPSVDEMRRRMQRTVEKLPWLVLEQDGQVVGYAYASPHHERIGYKWVVNASIYIDARNRRRGFGRALYTVLFELLRHQGYFTAYAGITLPNPASIALHERMGFEAVGVYRRVGYKLGAWHDVGWWELTLKERALNPPDPLPLPDLIGSTALDHAFAAGQAFLYELLRSDADRSEIIR
ncbi:MAG TPA: arsinothricin resistance N-acetyltransferase ArsN1 family B [Rhodothermales bacterium]|nr:arsinothricin resistance N-acetyltransferase ArsN1 family B [Rhodothermales bacterium]